MPSPPLPEAVDHDAAPLRDDIRQLTGLRGFAAVNVALAHYGIDNFPVLRDFQFADTAVDVFFCLSSFTLCLVYGAGIRRKLDLRSYLVARVARVYPLFIVTMLVTLWYSLGWGAPQFLHASTRALMVQAIRQILLLTEVPLPFLGPMGGWVAPAWSISVEAFCYVLVFLPLFALSFRARRLSLSMLVLLCMVLTALAFVIYVRCYNPAVNVPFDQPPLSLLAQFTPLARGITMFTAGWLVYIVALEYPEAKRVIGDMTDPLAIAFLAVIASEKHNFLSAASAVIIAPFLILGLLNGRSITARFLASRPMHFLGVISFSLYLWHLPVRSIAFYWWPWTSDKLIVHGQLYPLSIALAVSVVSFFCLEMPARNFIKRFGRRPVKEAVHF